MVHEGAAICFVLASPRAEQPLETIDRRFRSFLNKIPGVSQAIPPRWSPRRRMGYGAGLRACVQSLRRSHLKLPPVILLKSGEGVTLADVDEIISIDSSLYESIPFTRSFYGQEIYFKIEVFKLRQWDRIVYLDCDTIVMDDISPLWDMTQYAGKGLYAVRETAEMGSHPDVIGKFNTGVMVINPPLIHPDSHRRMVEIAHRMKSYDGSDQGVINRYFTDMERSPGELEVEYNVMVSAKKLGKWNQVVKDRLRILHYVNFIKPWSLGHDQDPFFDVEFKRLWDEAYEVRGRTEGSS
jgi:alpha-N-acetylglucosamine transferase